MGNLINTSEVEGNDTLPDEKSGEHDVSLKNEAVIQCYINEDTYKDEPMSSNCTNGITEIVGAIKPVDISSINNMDGATPTENDSSATFSMVGKECPLDTNETSTMEIGNPFSFEVNGKRSEDVLNISHMDDDEERIKCKIVTSLDNIVQPSLRHRKSIRRRKTQEIIS